MVMSVVVRRASAPAIFKLDKAQSCSDNKRIVRNFNLMVMHPRAPKIRHLNASTSLLIELDENVKKVQVELVTISDADGPTMIILTVLFRTLKTK